MNTRALIATATIARFGTDSPLAIGLFPAWLAAAALVRFGTPFCALAAAWALLSLDLTMPWRAVALSVFGLGVAVVATVRAQALTSHEWRGDMDNLCRDLGGGNWARPGYDRTKPPRWWRFWAD